MSEGNELTYGRTKMNSNRHLDLAQGSLTVGLMFEGRYFFDGDFLLLDCVCGRHDHSVGALADVMQVRVSRRHVENLTANRLNRPLCPGDLARRNKKQKNFVSALRIGGK